MHVGSKLIFSEYLEPGKVDEPLFDTPWGKAGFLICELSSKYGQEPG